MPCPDVLLKPTKIRSYLAIMKARGFSAAAVLAGTGLHERELQDPALLVDEQQRERIIHNMLELSGDPALGLRIGVGAQLVDFGVLAYAQMSARSLRDAYSLWRRHSSAVGTTIPIRLEERGRKDWQIVYEIGSACEPTDWFAAEEIIAMAVSLGPSLAGPVFAIRECCFSYPPPPHWQRYEALLQCTVHFNAEQTCVRMRSPQVDWPLPGCDAEFHALCLRHLQQLERHIGQVQPITSRLRSLLVNRPAAPPSLDEAAVYVGMSPRSLRRHLQQEQTHYQALIDRVRLDLATEYLKTERRPIKEVGFELGYGSVSAFRRAFKSWTGRTIQEFLASP